jgi:hypothetical protein
LPDDPSLYRDMRRKKSSFDSANREMTVCERSISSNNPRGEPFELAILELRGVVLFPGSTIPIKLRNRSMIQYLGRQIQQCRMHPNLQPKVELGILTFSETILNQEDISNDDPEYRVAPLLWRQRAHNPYSRMLGRLNQHRSPPQNPRYRENRNDSPSVPVNPYVGRIGTVATVRHTHERTKTWTENDSNHNNNNAIWSHYENTNELVFTAIGTSRFRIVRAVDDRNTIFLVEELVDDAMARPYSRRLFSSIPDQFKNNECREKDVQLYRQSLMAWNLSQVTPLPYHIHPNFSPWYLMEKIRDVLKMNSGRNNLPALAAEDIKQRCLERKYCTSFACKYFEDALTFQHALNHCPRSSDTILLLGLEQRPSHRVRAAESSNNAFYAREAESCMGRNSEDG